MADERDDKKSLAEEAKGIVEDMDDLADEVGLSFWDGADLVIWILAGIVAIIGLIACLESGGAGCLVSLLALVLAALDTIAKLIDLAEKDAAKQKAEALEKRIADLERRIRDKVGLGD